MKNLVIIIGTIILGCLVFNMMVGDGNDTIKSNTRDVIRNSVLVYQEE